MHYVLYLPRLRSSRRKHLVHRSARTTCLTLVIFLFSSRSAFCFVPVFPMSSVDPQTFISQEFTHVVVGGGTAGLVVAARLSEDPSLKVGILEAGEAAFDDPRINVPGRFGENLGGEQDWQFETTKQDGLGGRSLPFPRGKVLGGSSALNFMTWNRGCREDYDAWEALGNEGWGFDGLLSVSATAAIYAPC